MRIDSLWARSGALLLIFSSLVRKHHGKFQEGKPHDGELLSCMVEDVTMGRSYIPWRLCPSATR